MKPFVQQQSSKYFTDAENYEYENCISISPLKKKYIFFLSIEKKNKARSKTTLAGGSLEFSTTVSEFKYGWNCGVKIEENTFSYLNRTSGKSSRLKNKGTPGDLQGSTSVRDKLFCSQFPFSTLWRKKGS